jgi:hypothetical protein
MTGSLVVAGVESVVRVFVLEVEFAELGTAVVVLELLAVFLLARGAAKVMRALALSLSGWVLEVSELKLGLWLESVELPGKLVPAPVSKASHPMHRHQSHF